MVDLYTQALKTFLSTMHHFSLLRQGNELTANQQRALNRFFRQQEWYENRIEFQKNELILTLEKKFVRYSYADGTVVTEPKGQEV